jgi:hypothetical protein
MLLFVSFSESYLTLGFNKPAMRITFLLILLIFSLTCYTQVITPILKDKNWEQWDDRVLIGAEFNVGIMSVDAGVKVNPKSFFTKISKLGDKYLCASITSKDGKYKASLEYDISKISKVGVYEFELPTKHKEKLKNYKESEVAIIVTPSLNCKSSGGKYYISSWRNIGKIDVTKVYINSETPVELIVIDNNDKRDVISCKKILESSAVSFNCECEIDAEKLKNSKKIFLMKVVRSNGKPEPKKHGEISIKI